MSDHLIAEANRHAKALPKMTLPTTKPNDLDLAWYRRECELLQDRNEALERENAALREDSKIVEELCALHGCGREFLMIWCRAAAYAQKEYTRKEAQP